jgi:uncharacterized membrane protein (UPF0127 family)
MNFRNPQGRDRLRIAPRATRAVVVVGWVLASLLAGCEGDDACEGRAIRVAWAQGAVEVCAAVAKTEEERRRGLGGRPPLEPGEALLIVFPLEGEACITNEPVPYAIDVLLLDRAGGVTEVLCGLPPNDPEAHCTEEVKAALELRSPEGCDVPVGARTEGALP